MEGNSGKVLIPCCFSNKPTPKRSVTKMPSSKEDSDPKYLPSDLVYEILIRSPRLTTLDSCKLISKGWNEVISSPEFMPNYCKNTKNVCGFILQGNSARKRQEFVSLEDTQIDELGRIMTTQPGGSRMFSSNDYDIKILASSKQGILLAAGVLMKEQMFYIGKPSTDDWKCLPHPNFWTYQTKSSAVVVLGSKPFRYKITRLSHRIDDRRDENSRSYHCEVFDSTTREWETKLNVGLGYKVYLDSSAGQPVTIGNLVHWLTTDHQVLSFDSKNDTYSCFPLPEIGSNEHKWRTLVEYDGKLGVMCTDKEEDITQVWVRKDVNCWRMVREFKLEESLKRDEARPVGLYNRDIVLLTAPEKVLFYSLQRSRVLRTLKTNTHGAQQKVFPFRSDFVEVDLLFPGNVLSFEWESC